MRANLILALGRAELKGELLEALEKIKGEARALVHDP